MLASWRETSNGAKVVLVAGVVQAQAGMIMFNLGLNFGFTSLGDQVGKKSVMPRPQTWNPKSLYPKRGIPYLETPNPKPAGGQEAARGVYGDA